MSALPKIYLVCGVSGAGKTWVCNQLTDKFNYVPHDEHYGNIYQAVDNIKSGKDIITECPFGERIQKENFENKGYEVVPVFVIEKPDLVAWRYQARENKPIQKSAYTRASTIINRALEWNAFYGSSQQVLDHLKGLK